MKVNKKGIRLIAFMMTFFMLFSELSVASYAASVDFSSIESVEDVVAQNDIVAQNEVQVLDETNQNIIVEDETVVSDEDEDADESKDEKLAENSETSDEDEIVEDADASSEDAVEETADEEQIDAEVEEALEEIVEVEESDLLLEKISIKLNDNSSAHAKVFYWSKAQEKAEFVGFSENDNYADVITEVTEELSTAYTYIKVEVDNQYELALDENSGLAGIVVNGENGVAVSDADQENVYKVLVTDQETLDICINTNAISYSVNFENESETVEDLKAYFSNDIVDNEGIIDIGEETDSYDVEKDLYVKLPNALVVEETEFNIIYDSLALYYGEEAKDIVEVFYEGTDYSIYKIVDAGETYGDVLLKAVSSVVEEELNEEDSASEEDLDAVTKRKVVVKFDEALVKVKARIGSQYADLVEAGMEGKNSVFTCYVPDGETFAVYTYPENHAVVKGAYIQNSTKLTTSKTGEFSFKPSNLYVNEMVIESACIYEDIVVNTFTGLQPNKEKGIYQVDYNGSYAARIVYGPSISPAEIIDYKLAVGSVNLNDYVMSVDSNTTLFMNLASIDTAKIAGKTLSLTINYWEDSEKKTTTLKFAVTCPITSVTVSGAKFVTDHSEISALVGIEKRFKVTTNDKTKVDLSKLTVVNQNPSAAIISFDAATSELYVFASARGSLANADFYFQYDGNRIVGDKFNFRLVPEVASLTKVGPTVKVDSATDTDINVRLALPKGYSLYDYNPGDFYYHIEAVAVVTDKAPLAENMKDKVDYYIPAYSVISNGIHSIRVAKDGIKAGQGKAQKYNVSVSVVISSNDYSISPINVNGVDAVSKIVKVSAATQNPYYETKIAVKKLKTGIMQGQKDLLMAQITNSAKATYRDGFEVVGIEWQYKKEGYYPCDKITVDEDELRDGRLVVSASTSAYALKDVSYRIKIKALHDEDTMETVTEFVFKVTPAISWFNIISPSERLYKAYNKSATLALDVKAFDYDGTEVKLNAKNVKYEIVDANKKGIDDPEMNSKIKDAVSKKLITVANGKVTVDKKFILDADDANNNFRVKAIAIDCPENGASYYSDVIGLVSQAQVIAELRWINEPSYDDVTGLYNDFNNYTTNYNNNRKSFSLYIDNEYHLGDAVQGYLVALDQDGYVIKDVSFKASKGKFDTFYSLRDKANAKCLFFRSQQYISGTYSITATMNNGTKSSKTYTFKASAGAATYYSADSLGGYINYLRVQGGDENGIGTTSYYETDGYAPIVVNIKEVNGGRFDKTVKVTGGTLVKTTTSGAMHHYYIIPTAATTRVSVEGTLFNWTWWYSYRGNVWNYSFDNEVFSTYKSVNTDGGKNTTSYISSVLATPVDNTVFAGYTSGVQNIKYKITSGYTYQAGDIVAFMLDPLSDGVNKNANRKPLNKYLYGSDIYDGWGRDIIINSDKTFDISPAFQSVLDAATKPGEYKYYCMIYDKDYNVKSNPFEIKINVKSIVKQSGDIKPASIVSRSADSTVKFDWNTTKPNVSNLSFISIKNTNVNGTPSDFTKYFKVNSSGQLVFNSSAPGVVKDTKITGWITYGYYAPNGYITNTKQVTITVKP